MRPRSAYAGNLYSEEYFTLLRGRLKPGGMAATWVPSERTRAAFMKVFPYVLSAADSRDAAANAILIGSTQPITFDRAAVVARLSDPRVRKHYDAAGIDIHGLLSTYLQAPIVHGPEQARDPKAETNTDLFPRDEFDVSPVFGRMRRASGQ